MEKRRRRWKREEGGGKEKEPVKKNVEPIVCIIVSSLSGAVYNDSFRQSQDHVTVLLSVGSSGGR